MRSGWRRALGLVLSAASLVAAARWLAGAPPAEAQVSPGPLAKAHESLDGPLHCFQCHGKGGAMREKCLDCHEEIAWTMQQSRGVHAREKRECATCHPEHAGREFDLVHWDEGAAERFDHRRAGYTLDGKHATLECRACHKPEFQRAPSAAIMKRAQPAESWLGLGTACASCHKDPHSGSLGAQCTQCHVTASWQRLNEKSFNHDRTRYPLRGRHAAVRCASCHDPVKAWGRKPAFAACGDCHRDAHRGQATIAGKTADCAACHDLKGFSPSTFTVAQHRASSYPLEGLHARVACTSCHRKEPQGSAVAATLGSARVRMRPAHERCARCHADAHGGEFAKAGRGARAAGNGARAPERGARAAGSGAGAPERGACETCHGVGGWRPSRVDVAVHARYDFALEGGHAAVPCLACHKGLAQARPAGTPLTFEMREARCETCHENPHGAQFAKRRDRGSCDGCHGVERFVPAARFDHNRDSAFRLEGAHARTACARCHPAARDARGASRVTYRPVSGRCESCHDTRPGPLKTFLPIHGGSAPLLASRASR